MAYISPRLVLAPTDCPGPTIRLLTLPLMGALMDALERFRFALSSDACWAATLASASRS